MGKQKNFLSNSEENRFRCHYRSTALIIRSFSELCSELRTTLPRHFDAQKQTFKKMIFENFLFFTAVTAWHACCSLSCGEVKMKKKKFLFCSLLLLVLASEGCATVRGMGEDIQSLGRAVKRAVSE